MQYGRYFAKKVVFNGIKFDSDMECERYKLLLQMVDSGGIKDLQVHPLYLLQDEFVAFDGKKENAINYEADFSYYDNIEKKQIVEDVKGMVLPEFVIHRKLFNHKFRDSIELKVIKYSKTTGWVSLDDYKKVMKTKKKQLIDEKNYYKNIVQKQEREKVVAENKKQREIARLLELQKLNKQGKLSKTQNQRLNDLEMKYKGEL